MKRLALALLLVIAFASSGWTADFYINGSAAGGGDGSSGSPWNTLDDVTGLSAGDDIWIKCGSTISAGGKLVIPVSGVSSSNNTIIGAYYGTSTKVTADNRSLAGSMPVIDGGMNISTWATTAGFPEASLAKYDGIIRADNKSYITIQDLYLTKSGGYGVKINGSNNVTIQRCETYITFRSGINTENCTTVNIYNNRTDISSLSRVQDTSKYSAGIAIVGTDYGTIRYNKVTRSHGEGIDILKGCTLSVAEFNQVQNARSASMYFDRTNTDSSIRYNLIYCPSRQNESLNGVLAWSSGYSCGPIGLGDEAGTAYSQRLRVIGNLIANTNEGLKFSRTVDDGGNRDDIVMYGNTVVNCVNANVFVASGLTFLSNSYVRNNISVCTQTGYCGEQSTRVNGYANLTFSNNLWYDTITGTAGNTDSNAVGTGDVTTSPVLYSAMNFTKANTTPDSLTGQEFRLLSSSNAIDAGSSAPGATYDDILDLNTSNFITGCGPTGNGASSFFLVDQDTYTPWEIGADVYATSGGVVPSVPAGFSLSEATQNTLKAKWTASTPTVATSYQIKYGPTATWPDTGTSTVSGITTTEYTITGLTAETAYSAYVLGTNSTGNSAYSTADSETTLAAEVTGTVLSENCTSLADSVVPALTGLIDWTADGRCAAADAHDTNYAKMAITTAGLPTEYTVALEDATFTKIPSTYLAGTTGYRIYMWFANGATRLAVAFAADGIYLKDSNNADVLIPNTASYVTTDANQDWDIIVKDDPDSVYNLVTIYKNGTVIPEIVDHLSGDDYSLNDGLVTVECHGVSAAANDTEWSFDALTITSGLVYPDPPPAVTHESAYYAVDNCGDIKAASTITVVDGIGTFSAAQTDAALDIHAAKGFQVSFGSPATLCYVAERMNQSQYVLVNAVGAACANATAQTVNTFQPPFTTFAGFIAGVDGAGYMASGVLNTLDVDVNCYLGSLTETITSPITLDTFSGTSVEDCWRLYGSSGYVLSPDGTTGLDVVSNHFRFYDLQITHPTVDGTYQRSISINTGDLTVVDGLIVNPKLRGYTSNFDRHEGIGMADEEAAATSKLIIISPDISGYYDGDGTTGFGINIADANCVTYIYRATVTLGDVGINGNGVTTCKNCLVNTLNSYSGTFNETLSTNNLGADTDAPGANAVDSATVTFNSPGTGDFSLHPTDDHLFFDDGIDLSEDNIYPVTTDRVGASLTTPFSVGAYAAPNPGDLVNDLITDLTYSGYSYGTSTITFRPTYSVAGDSCVWTEGETTLYTDDGVDAGDDETACNNTAVEIELAPGSHTILLTASKATYDDDTETVTVVMLNEQGTFYAGSGEGCEDADPTSSNKPTVELDPGTIIKLCGTQAVFDMSSQPPGTYYLYGDDWDGGTFTGAGASDTTISPAQTLTSDASGVKVMNFTGKDVTFSGVTLTGGKLITTTPE